MPLQNDQLIISDTKRGETLDRAFIRIRLITERVLEKLSMAHFCQETCNVSSVSLIRNQIDILDVIAEARIIWFINKLIWP